MAALKRKLSRKRDIRLVLIKNLATSLVLDEQLTTTVPKAKTVLPYIERLISKARKGDLHNRRQVISGLLRDDAAFKLVDEIAPQLKRDSGFVRLKKAGRRRGDGSELATLSFVDELKQPEETKKKTTSKPKPAQPASKSEKSKAEQPKPKFDTNTAIKAPAGNQAVQTTKHLPQKKG